MCCLYLLGLSKHCNRTSESRCTFNLISWTDSIKSAFSCKLIFIFGIFNIKNDMLKMEFHGVLMALTPSFLIWLHNLSRDR